MQRRAKGAPLLELVCVAVQSSRVDKAQYNGRFSVVQAATANGCFWRAKRQRGSVLLRVRFLRTSGLIGERVTKILSGPGSLRGDQLNFPIALAEAIPLNCGSWGLLPSPGNIGRNHLH